MKIAFVAPNYTTISLFFSALVKKLIVSGNTVYVFAADDSYFKEVEQLGATCIPVKLKRFISPVSDIILLRTLSSHFKKEEFDLVSNFSVKANIFGSMAARLAGVPQITAMVLGAGVVFHGGPGIKIKIIRAIVTFLYKISFKVCNRICFVNEDDLSLFVAKKIVNTNKAILIPSGIGVDLTRFSIESFNKERLNKLKIKLGLESDSLVVLMPVARLIWSKGVKEFINAAEILSSDYPPVKFVLLGQIEKKGIGRGIGNVPQHYLEDKLHKKAGINLTHLGFRKDVHDIMAISDIIVLPSYYGEGLPQSLIEGLSLAKPIVTTNHVGCRLAVDHGVNGFLVPPKNESALVSAISVLIENDTLRQFFGKNSRHKAIEKFNKNTIIKKIITELYLLNESSS